MKKFKVLAALTAFCLTVMCISIFPIESYAAPASPKIESITWQDAQNAVLIWPHTDGASCSIYRSNTPNGEYALIGASSSGSYRDATAAYPGEYYYKIQLKYTDGHESELSDAVKSGTNPQNVSSVNVIMYHNFITEEDVKSGVEYEEYSISPASFESDLKYLKDNGYTTITSDDLISYMHKKKPLPKKAVIISIDDGTWGVYKNAWPLLKKYNMKADFSVIGEKIDEAWELVHSGGTRTGLSAPYCEWNEIVTMIQSGEINICSHSYGMHRFNPDVRIGAMINEGESIENYTAAIKEDNRLSISCITGWTNITPKTMSYPYSKRNAVTDEVILNNTTYEILMAGNGARATTSNYFVDGASYDGYQRIIKRPCRMDNIPISTYLSDAAAHDAENGVNTAPASYTGLSAEECSRIAAHYSPFRDVSGDSWYASSVYYAYLNSLFSGTSPSTFAPDAPASRAMAAAVLYRMEGSPTVTAKSPFTDVELGQWYTNAVIWAKETGIISGYSDGTFKPEGELTREQLSLILHNCSKSSVSNANKLPPLTSFADAKDISPWANGALAWAVSKNLMGGSPDGKINPKDTATRAQLAAILQRFIQNTAPHETPAGTGQSILTLKDAASFTEEDLTSQLMNKSIDEIHKAFGEPQGTLSGFYGDIYIISGKNIIIYYDENSNVIQVKISAKGS